MSRTRTVALAQLTTGWLFARHPSGALQLLGYPEDRPGARAVVRVLGLRQLLQGTVELYGGERTLRAGAGVDVVHALTCVAYARASTTGRRAGVRSALLAVGFAAAQVLAARPTAGKRDDRPSLTGRTDAPGLHRRVVAALPPMPRVASADSDAWPRPTESEQQVLVGGNQQRLVHLAGGVMDGAQVPVDPGTDHYDVFDSDRGPQRYVATDVVHEAGWQVFALAEEATQ